VKATREVKEPVTKTKNKKQKQKTLYGQCEPFSVMFKREEVKKVKKMR
jgi:hypothetical protein